MKLIMAACILICSISVYCQNSEIIYLSKNDSAQNYYMALRPDSSSKGLLIILGGFCTTPVEILEETELPDKACKAGYTVVMPYFLNDCDSIDRENIYIKRLTGLLPGLIEKYKIPEQKFIIGGHSIGGLRALHYAEMACKNNTDSYLRPNLVFGVDPPLDLKRLWNSFEYGLKISFSKASSGESQEQLRRFKIMYGGSPEQVPGKYEEMSAYYADAKDGGNIKYLEKIPVRLYCDPDIRWWIDNRRARLEYLNITDLVGAISQLLLLGNKNAELITALGKGFWSNGQRHPHAFSILDADEFIGWINSFLNKN